MTGSSLRPERPRDATDIDTSLFDPRQGDAEGPTAVAGSGLVITNDAARAQGVARGSLFRFETFETQPQAWLTLRL